MDIGLELGFKCLIVGQTGKKEEGSNSAQEEREGRPVEGFQERQSEQFDLSRLFVQAIVGD